MLSQVSDRPISDSLSAPGPFNIPAALATLARLYAEWSSKPGALPDPEEAQGHPEGRLAFEPVVLHERPVDLDEGGAADQEVCSERPPSQ